MPLYRVTVIQTAFNGRTRIEEGMSVIVNSNYYSGPDNYYPIVGNKEINDMFKSTYGLDLEKEGYLSSCFLKTERIDNETNSMNGNTPKTKGNSLLNALAQLLGS